MGWIDIIQNITITILVFNQMAQKSTNKSLRAGMDLTFNGLRNIIEGNREK